MTQSGPTVEEKCARIVAAFNEAGEKVAAECQAFVSELLARMEAAGFDMEALENGELRLLKDE